MNPIVIGMYKEIGGDGYPPIRELLSEAPIEGKVIVSRYLKEQPDVAASPGFMKDEITNERIPGTLLMYSDGVYAWRSEVVFYFDEYNLRLPEEFINHVFEQEGRKKSA